MRPHVLLTVLLVALAASPLLAAAAPPEAGTEATYTFTATVQGYPRGGLHYVTLPNGTTIQLAIVNGTANNTYLLVNITNTGSTAITAVRFYWNVSELAYWGNPTAIVVLNVTDPASPKNITDGWKVADYPDSAILEGRLKVYAYNSTYYLYPGNTFSFYLPLDANATVLASDAVSVVIIEGVFGAYSATNETKAIYIDFTPPKLGLPNPGIYDPTPLNVDTIIFVKPASYTSGNITYYNTSFNVTVGDYNSYKVHFDSEADAVNSLTVTSQAPVDAANIVSVVFNSWASPNYAAVLTVNTNVTNTTAGSPVEGWYNYTLTAEDYAGYTTGANMSVFVDNTPPTLSFSAANATNNTYQQVEPGKSIVFNFTFTDNSGFYKYINASLDFNKTFVENFVDLTFDPTSNVTEASLLAVNNGDNVTIEVIFPGTATGLINATLRIRDAAGHWSREQRIVLVVDREAPLVESVKAVNTTTATEFTFASGSKIYTNGALINMTGPFTGNVSVALRLSDDTLWPLNDTVPGTAGNAGGTVEIYVNGTPTALLDYNSLVAGWNGSSYVYGYSISATNLIDAIAGFLNTTLTDGVYAVALKAIDPSGRTSNWYNYTLIVDTSAPNITITTPINTIYNTATVTVNVTIDDIGPAGLYEVYAEIVNSSNAVVWNKSLTGLNGADTASIVENVTLPDGSYTLKVTAKDLAGNTETQPVSFSIDTTPPAITVSSPANNTWYNTSSITLSAGISDAIAGIDKLLVYQNGSLIDSVTVGGANSYTYTNTLTLSEGWYEIALTAFDTVNNNATVNVYFGVDTTPPSVEIISPANSSVVSSNNVSFTVAASDNLAGINVNATEVYVDGSLVTSYVTPPAYNGTHITFTIYVADGNHNITVKVYDYASNSNSSTVSILVDTAPPSYEFKIHQPTVAINGTNYTSPNPVISIIVNDAGRGVNTSSIVVEVDGSQVSYTSILAYNATAYNVTVELSGLSQGIHNLTVYASDNGGWSSNATLAFVVDATPPSLVVTAVRQLHEGAILEFSVEDSGTFQVGVERLVVRIGGVTITLSTANLSAAESSLLLCNSTGCSTVNTSVYPYVELVKAVNDSVVNDAPFMLLGYGKMVVYTANESTINVSLQAYDLVGNSNTTVVAAGSGEAGAWFPLILQPGWNLVGVPLISTISVNSSELAARLLAPAGAEVVRVLTYSGGRWLEWNPLLEGLGAATLKEMRDGAGYWFYVNSSGPVALIVDGYLEPPPGELPPEYQLSAGWNLVGYIRLGSLSAKNLTAPGAYGFMNEYITQRIRPYILAWDPVAKTYAVYWITDSANADGYWYSGPPTLKDGKLAYPGMAFWVYANEQISLIAPWGLATPN